MPTIDIREKAYARYLDSQGKPVSQDLGWHVSEQSSAALQKTGPRPKPVDLFSSQTVLQSERHDVRYQSGSFRTGDWTISGPCSYLGGAGPGTGLHQVGNLVNFRKCESRLRSRIKNASVNAVVALAERKSTLEMVGNGIKDILRTYRSLRGGSAFAAIVRGVQKPRTAKEKELANRWLEYSFGWVPLMSDIHGLAEEINKEMREGWDYYVKTSDVARRSSHWRGIGAYQLPLLTSCDETTSMRVSARFRIADTTAKSLQQYGVTNPAEFLWETIPLSFVVDWFIPVGDYLSSLDALVGIQNLTVARSFKTETVWTVNNAMGVGTQKITRKVRLGVGSTLMLPSMMPSLPNSPWSKLSLAVALLRQSQLSSGRTVPTRR